MKTNNLYNDFLISRIKKNTYTAFNFKTKYFINPKSDFFELINEIDKINKYSSNLIFINAKSKYSALHEYNSKLHLCERVYFKGNKPYLINCINNKKYFAIQFIPNIFLIVN